MAKKPIILGWDCSECHIHQHLYGDGLCDICSGPLRTCLYVVSIPSKPVPVLRGWDRIKAITDDSWPS